MKKPTNTQTEIWLIPIKYKKNSLREQITGDKKVGAE